MLHSRCINHNQSSLTTVDILAYSPCNISAITQQRHVMMMIGMMLYTICGGTSKFDMVTRGEGSECILGSATPTIPREWSFIALQFWGFSCICVYILLIQNDQFRHGNTLIEWSFYVVNHNIPFAQMRHALCEQQESFLFHYIFETVQIWYCYVITSN